MNRRRFFALSALAGAAPGPFSRLLLADRPDPPVRRSRPIHPLLRPLISSPASGFPTISPNFAAMFAPGPGPTQLVRSETWDDFSAQTQTQSNNGYVLSAMTSIQNLNRTWFYGAYQKGAGNYQLFRTSDPNAFQQMFAQLQSSYTLVDFNTAWELGQVFYSGYWLASSQPPGQTAVWDLDYPAFSSQLTALAKQGMRLTRVQAYPRDAATVHAAVFAPGNSGTPLFVSEAADTFFNDVTGKYGASTLVDLAFAPTTGNVFGYWRNKVTPSQFVYNQDWDTLIATAQQASAGGMILTSMAAYPNAPSFDDFFAANQAPFVQGYAYAVARDGQVIASGGGFARSPHEKTNPGKPYTADTRMNVASVSKAVTGIALEVLLAQKGISLDAPFWPLIQSRVANPDPSVKSVTLRNLAEMKSGMVQQPAEGPLAPPAPYTDIWSYLNFYLSQPLTGTPGVTYFYANTNFTILQGVIAEVSGTTYVDYVTKNVLEPAGIDTAIFSAIPDPLGASTLGYTDSQDTRPGYYPGAFGFVAAGGWITNVRELIKLLIAMRGTGLLPQDTVTEMFNGLIGWDFKVFGSFGTYYAKNGGLFDAAKPVQAVGACVVRLGEGYDCVLISNSLQPAGAPDIVSQVVNAFESRGVPASALPPGAPAITTIVQSASLLPAIAPGSLGSIMGTGFPGPERYGQDFIGRSGQLPIEVNGVEVRVGSQNAYVEYAGPAQITFLLPSNVPSGIANVEVTTPAGGMTTSVNVAPIAPGLFAYQLNGMRYPFALFPDTPMLVAATGAFSGFPTRPARAGDSIELFGTGMGPTNPAAPDGVDFTKTYAAASLAAFKLTIGGKAATVTSAALIRRGLFQLNVTIPTGLSGGDQPLVLSVNNIQAQPNLMLTVGA